MAKLTLTDLANLTSQTTAITQINANGALIEASIENTLSRDGTSPNTMTASLDMNSKNILNVANIDVTSITLNGISLLSSLPSITPRGVWVTATVYAVGDVVSSGNITYLANTAHTSASLFGTDNTSGYWTVFASLPATVQTPERFHGGTTSITLGATPTSEDYISLYFNGVYQNHDQFTISGRVVTFGGSTSPAGTNNVEVIYTVGTTSLIPVDGSVTTAKLDTSLDFDGITIIGLTVADVIQLESNAAASLPSASTAGGIIYVSDDTGGPTLAFSDGTIWRRVQDRAEISA